MIQTGKMISELRLQVSTSFLREQLRSEYKH